MDMSEVERVLGMTRQTVYTHIVRQNLNPVKKGGEWFFNGSEVYRFANKRRIGKNRHSPTNVVPETIAGRRKFSNHHIEQFLMMLRNFEMRYENQERYMPIFELEKMLTSVFTNFQDDPGYFTGDQVNEALNYMESRVETSSEPYFWSRIYETFEELFLEPNDEFDRRYGFEDLLIDVIIELTSLNKKNP